jgi:hypothetical protein
MQVYFQANVEASLRSVHQHIKSLAAKQLLYDYWAQVTKNVPPTEG